MDYAVGVSACASKRHGADRPQTYRQPAFRRKPLSLDIAICHPDARFPAADDMGRSDAFFVNLRLWPRAGIVVQ
ncbi:hypothetical protein [Paraburkholderia sp. J76]|uniref:hypothetical protein n=1 Tax=Paraburkholderia sp. J76 TaxID=2805439 RepID=UPI002ABE4E41|nr:hypothetical protein [Paraburkholderia sp. J76]